MSDTATPGEADSALPELSFVRPMPGFGGLTRFVLVRLGDGDGDAGYDGDSADQEAAAVLFELRSVEQPQVRFLVGVPTAFFPEYAVELDEPECEQLQLSQAGDALVLVILTVAADARQTTANLLAPVVINARTRSAAQVILSGSDWPVRAAVAA